MRSLQDWLNYVNSEKEKVAKKRTENVSDENSDGGAQVVDRVDGSTKIDKAKKQGAEKVPELSEFLPFLKKTKHPAQKEAAPELSTEAVEVKPAQDIDKEMKAPAPEEYAKPSVEQKIEPPGIETKPVVEQKIEPQIQKVSKPLSRIPADVEPVRVREIPPGVIVKQSKPVEAIPDTPKPVVSEVKVIETPKSAETSEPVAESVPKSSSREEKAKSRKVKVINRRHIRAAKLKVKAEEEPVRQEIEEDDSYQLPFTFEDLEPKVVRKPRRVAKPQKPKDTTGHIVEMWDKLPRHIQLLMEASSISIDDEIAQKSYKKEFRESRTDLIQRLLDPPMTLEETARVLSVCPTTVRRYTNAGLLPHSRTNGNQRRFRLSDVLSFLETISKTRE